VAKPPDVGVIEDNIGTDENNIAPDENNVAASALVAALGRRTRRRRTRAKPTGAVDAARRHDSGERIDRAYKPA
jgi:hypothetical protein